jgi:CHAD domain-containing protein
MSLRLDPAGLPHAEISTLMLEQTVRTGETLMGAFDDPHKGVHEARKRIKKIRALLSLMRSADPSFYKVEDRRWRDTARLLAGPREASALVETVDRFIAEFPEANRRGELDGIRTVLDGRRGKLAGDAAALRPAVGAAILSCAEAGEAVRDWSLPRGRRDMAKVLARGVRRSWKEADAAAALASRREREDDFHDLRKAVKRHAAHLALLRDIWPGDVADRRGRIEALGDRLGELNDIYVMTTATKASREGFADETEIAFFRELLESKRQALAGEIVEAAEALFSDRPRRLKRHFTEALEAAAEATAEKNSERAGENA